MDQKRWQRNQKGIEEFGSCSSPNQNFTESFLQVLLKWYLGTLSGTYIRLRIFKKIANRKLLRGAARDSDNWTVCKDGLELKLECRSIDRFVVYK